VSDDTPVVGPGQQGWVDAYLAAQQQRPAADGASGTVVVTIDGGRKNKVVFTEHLADGRATAVTDGPPDGTPDLELVVPADLAAAVFGGEVDPAVPFMQGRLKVAGDQALWWRLVEHLGDGAYRAALRTTVAG
jgi:putative sterol carrier protein